MKRQTIAMLTLGSFIVFSYSCTSIREIRPEALMSRKTKAKDIVRLEKTSGESIVFSKGQAGGVVGDSVTGIGAQESSLSQPLVFKPIAVPIEQVKKAYVQRLNIVGTLLAILAPVALIIICIFYDAPNFSFGSFGS